MIVDDVLEMRKRLDKYCTRKTCYACKLSGAACRCGRGTSFLKEKEMGGFDMTDDEIRDAYHIIFGGCKRPPIEKSDTVNHPAHYETGKFECIDVMIETQGVEAVKEYCLCNAFKYLYRSKRKNGLEDIRKAIWYLNKYVELEGEK